MQFSTITTLLTLAAVAAAVPTEVQARTTEPTAPCTNEQPNLVCCSGSLLDCALEVVGGNPCGGTAYCCGAVGTGLINVVALNCLEVL